MKRLKYILILALIIIIGCNKNIKNSKQIKSVPVQEEDTNTYYTPLDSNFKRMFYGKVKRSEEVVWQIPYPAYNENGELNKGIFLYYKIGNYMLPINIALEFNEKGNLRTYRIYDMLAHDGYAIRHIWTHYYNEEEKIAKMDLHSEKEAYVGPPFRTRNYYYNEEGLLSYETSHFIDINAKPVDSINTDSIIYRYESGIRIDEKRFLADKDDFDKTLKLYRDFGEHTLSYKVNDSGYLMETTEKNGPTTTYTYKDNYLYKKVVSGEEGTDTYVYYPSGVTKEADLSSYLKAEIEFAETGDLIIVNGNKYADYAEYDEKGNWTTRLIYMPDGKPHTFTERKIEYYE